MGGDVQGMIGGAQKHNNPLCLIHVKPVPDTEFDDATIVGIKRVVGIRFERQNRSLMDGCFAFYTQRELFLCRIRLVFDELFLINLWHLLCNFDNRWHVANIRVTGMQCMGYFGYQSDLRDKMMGYTQQNCGKKFSQKSWRMACFEAKILADYLLFHRRGDGYAFGILL